MKSYPLSFAGTILLTLLCTYINAQSFGTTASAVWITNCNQSNFFNTSGNPADLVGPSGNTFTNSDLGIYTQNSGTLILRGAQVKTFKDPVNSNVCGAKMYYRIYLQSATPGVFTSVDLPFLEDCSGGTFSSGGTCNTGDQKWQQLSPSLVNLTARPAGKYVLEVYYEVTGSSTSTSGCSDLVSLNNGGNNYKAFFSIQSPTLSSTNPASCFGNEGSITISGLIAGATYQLTYSDDGFTVGPNPYVANGSGQIVVSGLNKGFYSNISLQINGCTTYLFTGVILSDPIYVPVFTAIPPFCAGSAAPVLPTTSNNGISGTWSPATVDNQATGTYTFNPSTSPNQCGIPITITINVIPKATPTFSFGTSLTICAGGTVPSLPTTSTNGITGTWSPSAVDDQNSGVYTFTPTTGLCASPATFTVTVNPNIPPTFSFGTDLTICAGGSIPSLPATSANGITGTWSPSVVDNQNPGTYTFTPDAGQCATTATYSVTVNPILTPAFSFGTSLVICGNGTVPSLPGTSANGITGTWSPAVVDNQNSGTYTFTPDAGECAVTTTFSVTVNPNIPPTFSFGTGLVICENGTVPSLPTTSANSITGTWNPSVVDNQNSGTYIFTPDAGQCATTATYSVTVNPNITPAFSFGTDLTVCAGGTVPSLPATSTNNITGTWSPSVVDNQNSGTYTFTPATGQCALPTTFNVTINPNITPVFSFGTSLMICAGGTVPSLPTTSTNGIAGTWSPSVVGNQNSATYTFTPSTGQCAVNATFNVTVAPNITPAFNFGTSLTICTGGTVPSLANTSTNGITGTWSPSVIDNQNSGSYTFTPTAGQCALATSFGVTVNPNITPVFSFGTNQTICSGGSVPSLVTTSTNGITGTWSPATVSNQNSATYTFTPTAGQCAVPATFAVTINPNITPVFSFGTSLTICAGGTVPSLPNMSTNGITGTWSPSVAGNQNSATYTFTPGAGQCAVPATFNVTVNPNITPTFNFGAALTICAGGTVPSLPTTSTNGITGTWSPATVDNQNSGSYTFTPTAGQCALVTSFSVTVNPNITPVFSFGTSLTICAGGTVPSLPTTSTNGITGTWSPSTVDNQNSGVYTFTPNAGQCVTPAAVTFSVTVNTNIIPAFSFGNNLTICAGGAVPSLPTTSTNGITGTWNPSAVNNQASGVYVFTPTSNGQCITSFLFNVTVNPIVSPVFSFGNSQSLCIGSVVPVLSGRSVNGISGTWNPSVVSNQGSDTYAFTPSPGECANGTSFVCEINAIPSLTIRTDTTVFDGAVLPAFDFVNTPGSVVNWTNTNPGIGLSASGTGSVPSFIAVNRDDVPVTATITATPKTNGCSGSSQSYVIKILPLDKNVFVPNVFSPNGDGKNDILYVYGNYIDKVDMKIFNQWGQQIATISDKAHGWDGRSNGNAQPVGVYVYVLKATLTNGRQVNLKGSITLVR